MIDYQEELEQYQERIDELAKEKRYAELRDLFLPMEPADIALLLEEGKQEQMPLLYRLLPKETAAEVFVELEPESQEMLINGFSNTELTEVLDELYLDDAVDIVEEMPASVVIRILDKATPEMRKSINEILKYPEDSAGSIMNMEFLSLKKDMTVEDAFKRIRRIGGELETINILYVTDPTRHLLGVLSVRDLLLAEEDDLIEEIMDPDVVWAKTTDDKEDVAQALSKYDFLAMPVVDKEQRLVGIVTVDDAMDIEKQEDATQLARFGGTVTTDGTDLDILESPFRKMFSVRVFWLVLLTLFGVVTSTFVAAQEEILSQVIVLAAFIAPIVDMGGNAGSQSATLVIRAMALGDVSLRWQDVWRVVRRELPVAAALGLVVAAMETVLAWFSKGIDLDVLLVVGLSMLVCTVLGGIIGVLLPFVARRIGTDPATLSSPLITSIMDLVGVFIYFAFAYAFLGDLLQQAG